MSTIHKIFLIIVLALISLTVNAKRSLALWTAIRDMGVEYNQGQRDSAYSQACHLLINAKSNNDDLAQCVLHNFMGIFFEDKNDKRNAVAEYLECIEICERNDYLKTAEKSQAPIYFQTMLNAYGQLVLYFNDDGSNQRSLRYAKVGMEWVEKCNNAATRLPALSIFSDEMMEQHQYGIIYEPMKHGVKDAIQLGKPDLALKMTAHIIYIEHHAMKRELKDIPWVRVGKQLLPQAKTESAKTTFLAAINLDDSQDNPNAELSYNGLKDTNTNKSVLGKPVDKRFEKKDSIQTRVKYIRERNERLFALGIVLILVIVVFIVYILLQKRRRKREAINFKSGKDKSYRDGQEAERSRLAKELHDGVSNQLLAVEMQLQEEGATSKTLQLLSDSREQVRRVSHELIPPEFEYTTLDVVVNNYCTELNHSSKCNIDFSSSASGAEWKDVKKTTSLEVYRILQEIISNILKHSDANNINVGIHLNKDALNIIVSDDSSFKDNNPAAKSTGIGKQTIRQRTEAIKGKLEIYHYPFGNVVKITVKNPFIDKNNNC